MTKAGAVSWGRRGELGTRWMVAIALSLCAFRSASAQIYVEAFSKSLTSPSGTAAGRFAVVDLTDPRLSVRVTDPRAPGSPSDATATTVPAWRTAVGAKLAINANFFGTVSGSNLDIVGLCISNGVLVSPAEQNGATPDPALTFDAVKKATIGYVAPGSYANIVNAVAGVGPRPSEPGVAGTMLVIDGVNTGASARVSPTTREARTAVGVDITGKTLFIATVGKKTGSVGMTLAELGAYMVERGAWRAINLDGGGSTTWVHQADNGTVTTDVGTSTNTANARAVASHLGFVVAPTLVTDLTRRPVRGAYMRPPPQNVTSPPANFESSLATVAAAGITDVYLETLYWGRDTGANGITQFPQRFSIDYLKQAIAIANKYNIRVHAWCETGYLDFGSSPSALLAANPTWVIKHVSVARNAVTPGICSGTSLNTLTGDLVNQRFVNLGNPGVQAVLSAYFTSVTQKYPALWGVQSDYNFFAIGNPPANLDNAAPWSYDDWALANFRDASGSLVNPIAFVSTCNGLTYHPNWINWNRNNVTTALNAFRSASESVSTQPLFSAVSFGGWTDPIQLSKFVDLPGWAGRAGNEALIVMAYGTSAASIEADIQKAKDALPNRRVIAALANLPGARPDVTTQLNSMASLGIQEFAWFRLDDFIVGGVPPNSAANPNAATYQSQLSTWIKNTAAKIQGDVSADGTSNGTDGYIDARDRQWFFTIYTGTPVTRTAANDRCDLNRDSVINATDESLFIDRWKKFIFNEEGVVDSRALVSLRDAYSNAANPNPLILNRWDLTGDGKVDINDELILYANATTPFLPNPDVNADGVVSIEDLYAQYAMPADVTRNGVINQADIDYLIEQLRLDEPANSKSTQR